MKNKILMSAVLVSMLTMGQAFAAGLTGAQIAATYNGAASDIYGADFLNSSSGSNNVTGLAALEGMEFITNDSLFQIDFNAAGLVTFYWDGAANVPTSAFTFDFGSSLGTDFVTSFVAQDVSAITAGSPTFSVVSGNKISADFSSVVGSPAGFSITAQVTAVPEPLAPAMLLAGLGVLGLSRRFSKK